MEASVLYKATQDNYTTYKGYMFKMELEKDKIFALNGFNVEITFAI